MGYKRSPLLPLAIPQTMFRGRNVLEDMPPGTQLLALTLTLVALCLQQPHSPQPVFSPVAWAKRRNYSVSSCGLELGLILLPNPTLSLAPSRQIDKWLGVPWSINAVHTRSWQRS